MKRNTNILMTLMILLALVLPAQAKTVPPELSMVPANAQWVVHLDVKTFAATELSKHFLDSKGSPLNEANHEVSKHLNVDLMKDVSWITVFGQGKDAAFCAKGNFDQKHLISLVKEKTALKSVSHGKHTIYTWEKGDENFGAFAGKMFVYARSESVMKGILDSLGGKKKGGKSAASLAQLKGVPAGTFLSAMVDDIPSLMGKHDRTFVLKQTRMAFFMAMENNGNLGLKLKMTTESPEAAKNIEQIVRGFIAMAKLKGGEDKNGDDDGVMKALKYLDSLKVDLNGNVLQLALSVPSKELTALLHHEKRHKKHHKKHD